QGPPGEFHSNLHRGGSGDKVRITPQEWSAAVRAARTLGLNVCGVDMLRSKNGPLVLEGDSSPGIEGLEKATGIDAAVPITEFLERHAAPRITPAPRGRVSLCPVRLDCDTKANGAACSYGKSRQAYREI